MACPLEAVDLREASPQLLGTGRTLRLERRKVDVGDLQRETGCITVQAIQTMRQLVQDAARTEATGQEEWSIKATCLKLLERLHCVVSNLCVAEGVSCFLSWGHSLP